MSDALLLQDSSPLATSKLQSALDTADTIIAPLEQFNSVANTMTDVLGLYLHSVPD